MATTSNTLPQLPLEKRHWPIQYQDDPNGRSPGDCIAYPINYDELYNLKGRLLTIVDATFTDSEQRKAMKDIVWQALQAWMNDIEHADHMDVGWTPDGQVREFDPEP